jgi:glycine/D-amino acid oxidase-like deaminating enzyme
LSKSETPDLLISIFTKEREVVDVYQNYGFGWGWGWGPGLGMGYSRAITTPEGTLFIDIIDAKTKELIWQGQGTGYLSSNTDKKEERIREFVSKILEQYPPQQLKK